MGGGTAKRKGQEGAGEINRIRQIQLMQRRKDKKKKDVRKSGTNLPTKHRVPAKRDPQKRETEQEKQRSPDRPRQ